MISDKLKTSPSVLCGNAGAQMQYRTKRVWRLPWFGLCFSMPILIWQLIFFVFPLVFLVAISFWLVRNFRMVPTLEWLNWSYMLSRGFFWDAYVHTLASRQSSC
jgi:ABC-type spermidine/putrescine transport system permease subunit I